MRSQAIVSLTISENVKGQIFWIAFVVGLVCIALSAVLSGAALSTEARLLDTSTYFLMDVTLFLTGSLLGSNIFAKDFSSRGLAEIVLVRGSSRIQLFHCRLISHWISLAALGIGMTLTRIVSFYLSGNGADHDMSVTLQMLIYSCIKACLACTFSAWLGCVTRPTIAFLGTIGTFMFGHFATGASGISGLIDPEGAMVSESSKFFLNIFKVWNPNSLVLDSTLGKWIVWDTLEQLRRLGWGLSAVGFFLVLGYLSVRKKNIESMKI